jgi:hypothetical protein
MKSSCAGELARALHCHRALKVGERSLLEMCHENAERKLDDSDFAILPARQAGRERFSYAAHNNIGVIETEISYETTSSIS